MEREEKEVCLVKSNDKAVPWSSIPLGSHACSLLSFLLDVDAAFIHFQMNLESHHFTQDPPTAHAPSCRLPCYWPLMISAPV